MTAIEIRELVRDDLGHGFLESLAALTRVDLTPEQARAVFDRRPSNQFTFVALADGRVIGTASLFIDQKFIHGGGRVGHIEDVAVATDFQRRGIGTELVKFASERARADGCYKVILHCAAALSAFYARIGFRDCNIGMRLDLNP